MPAGDSRYDPDVTRRLLHFTGDSITDCGRRTDPRGLGGGWVDVVADRLTQRGDSSRIVNSGVSGDRVGQLADRFAGEVLAEVPDVLTVFIGVNDTQVAFYRGEPTAAGEFERRYAELLAAATAAGVPRVILIDPFVLMPVNGAWYGEGFDFSRRDLDLKRPIVARLASVGGHGYVPLQVPFDEAVELRGGAAVAPDGVHPSPLGHRLIATEWLRVFDAH